jgi:hypothetical protein
MPQPTQPYSQSVQGVWDTVHGTVTFWFPSPPVSLIATVTAQVGEATPDLTFVAYVAGLKQASWSGSLLGGPVQYGEGAELRIVGTALVTPLTATWVPPVLTCTVTGESSDAAATDAVAPNLVPSTSTVVERVPIFSGTDSSITVTTQPGWRSLGVILESGTVNGLQVAGGTTGADYFNGNVKEGIEQLIPIDAALDATVILSWNIGTPTWAVSASLGDDVVTTVLDTLPVATFEVGGSMTTGVVTVASNGSAVAIIAAVQVALKRWTALRHTTAPTTGDVRLVLGTSSAVDDYIDLAGEPLIPFGRDLDGLLVTIPGGLIGIRFENFTDQSIDFDLWYDVVNPSLTPT